MPRRINGRDWLTDFSFPPDKLYPQLSCIAFLTDNSGLQYLAVIVIGCHPDLTLQNHKGLCFCEMVVYWYLGARFQCVEEAVALVLKALVEIVVLCKQSGRAERILSLGDFFASSATCVSRVSSIIFISLSFYRV